MNMRVMEKSRKKPRPGDVFVFRMPDGLYRFGSVVRVDAMVGGFPDCVLIYIYSVAQKDAKPIPKLRCSDLLVPPLATNRQPWLRGFFRTVEHRDIGEMDILDVHCFFDPLQKTYVDADGRKLGKRTEPCGFDGLESYRTIDDHVSRALGIPEAPDEKGNRAPVQPSVSSSARRRDDVEHAVLVHIVASGDLDLDGLEDPIEQELDKHDVGELDGHEIALDGSHAVIYLYGKDADLLADVVLPVINKLGLPAGSYVVKRYGEPGDAEERVEL